MINRLFKSACTFDAATLQAVRDAFEMHMTPRGALSCLMRVDLLVRIT